MFSKTKLSLQNINYKLYFALLVLGLCPTVYTTVRVFYLGSLPSEWSFSIAGQLSWVNLLYEIINEAIILPLFFFIGKVATDKKEFTNRVKTGLFMSLGIYLVLSAVIVCFCRQTQRKGKRSISSSEKRPHSSGISFQVWRVARQGRLASNVSWPQKRAALV